MQQGPVPVEERLDRIEACLKAIQALLLGLPPGLPARDSQGLLRADEKWLLPEVVQADSDPTSLPPGLSWVGAVRVGYRMRDIRWLVDTDAGQLSAVADLADWAAVSVWVFGPASTTVTVKAGPLPNPTQMATLGTVTTGTGTLGMKAFNLPARYVLLDATGQAGSIRAGLVGLAVPVTQVTVGA